MCLRNIVGTERAFIRAQWSRKVRVGVREDAYVGGMHDGFKGCQIRGRRCLLDYAYVGGMHDGCKGCQSRDVWLCPW